MKWEFIYPVNGVEHKIVLSKPEGLPDAYYVMIDNYHSVEIVRRPWGYFPYNKKSVVLTGDDLGVLVDLVNQMEGYLYSNSLL